MTKKEKIFGPYCYQHILAQKGQDKVKAGSVFECFLYSDSRFYGEILAEDCPYEIAYIFDNYNPCSGNMSPIALLRIYSCPCEGEDEPKVDHTGHDYSQEEIASLLSLMTGRLIQAGSINRVFHQYAPGKWMDSFGEPVIDEEYKNIPTSLPVGITAPILPNKNLTVKMPSELFLKYSCLLPKEATVFLRSASLYQQGLFLAERQPEYSWLMFVSAIETVANYFMKNEDNDEITKLKSLDEDLFTFLTKHKNDKDDKVVVARIIKDYLDKGKVKKKFLKFIDEFFPVPPKNRPQKEEDQISWDKENIIKVLGCIYDYRSSALHAGKPFPSEMCSPPLALEELAPTVDLKRIYGYKEFSTLGDGKTSIYLYIFEYVTREVLLNWYCSFIDVVRPEEKFSTSFYFPKS